MTPDNPPAKPKAVPYIEYGWLLVLSTLWGSSFSFLKLTVASFPPITAIAIRTALAGTVLYAVLRWNGIRLPRDWESWKSFVIISVINTVFPFILIAWGLQNVNASLAVILNSTTPIFAFLITLVLTGQEPVTQRRVFGVAAGLTGIVLIVGMSALSGLGQQLLPQLAIVLASVSYASSAIYGRAFRNMNPAVPACGSLLFGSAILTPMALVLEHPWTVSPTATSLMALFVLGVLCTALGNVLYFRLLGTLGSLGTTAQSYLRVPIGVLAGIFLVGEQMTSTAGIGLVCVVAGVMAMTWPSDRPLPYPARTIARTQEAIASFRAMLPPLATEYMLLVFVATLWAGSYVWVKIGLRSIPPLTLMAGRIVIASLFLLVVLRIKGLALPSGFANWRRYAIQGVLSTVLPFTLVAWGQQWVDAGPAAILNSVSPVFAFLITWGLTRHEPATALKLAGVVLGLAGVAVVIGPASLGGLGGSVGPKAAIVLSSLCYALGAINSRHFRNDDPVLTAACAMLGASALILPFALVVERPWTASPTRDGILAMLTLGIVSTGLGYIFYFRLVRVLGSIGVSSQSYLRAPIGVILAAMLLGEPVTWPMLAGMALVVLGVAAMTIQPKAHPSTA
jgi:drug/metabolite transporter (DMT)-like permease